MRFSCLATRARIEVEFRLCRSGVNGGNIIVYLVNLPQLHIRLSTISKFSFVNWSWTTTVPLVLSGVPGDGSITSYGCVLNNAVLFVAMPFNLNIRKLGTSLDIRIPVPEPNAFTSSQLMLTCLSATPTPRLIAPHLLLLTALLHITVFTRFVDYYFQLQSPLAIFT